MPVRSTSITSFVSYLISGRHGVKASRTRTEAPCTKMVYILLIADDIRSKEVLHSYAYRISPTGPWSTYSAYLDVHTNPSVGAERSVSTMACKPPERRSSSGCAPSTRDSADEPRRIPTSTVHISQPLPCVSVIHVSDFSSPLSCKTLRGGRSYCIGAQTYDRPPSS